jgi:hypothetical protein
MAERTWVQKSVRRKLQKIGTELLHPPENLEAVFTAQKWKPRQFGCLRMLISFAWGAAIVLLFPKQFLVWVALFVVLQIIYRIAGRWLSRIVVVTDRRILVCQSGLLPRTPPVVLREIPRATRIGPTSAGSWRSDSLGERLYIHDWFQLDVARADAVARSREPTTVAELLTTEIQSDVENTDRIAATAPPAASRSEKPMTTKGPLFVCVDCGQTHQFTQDVCLFCGGRLRPTVAD